LENRGRKKGKERETACIEGTFPREKKTCLSFWNWEKKKNKVGLARKERERPSASSTGGKEEKERYFQFVAGHGHARGWWKGEGSLLFIACEGKKGGKKAVTHFVLQHYGMSTLIVRKNKLKGGKAKGGKRGGKGNMVGAAAAGLVNFLKQGKGGAVCCRRSYLSIAPIVIYLGGEKKQKEKKKRGRSRWV